MSKILPYNQYAYNDIDSLDDEVTSNHHRCPRYEKHLKRLGNAVADSNQSKFRSKEKLSLHHQTFHGTSPSPTTNDFNIPNCTKLDEKTPNNSNKAIGHRKRHKPLRSRSFFLNIRQKGRNFGIRCKTSVDLWRKWIKRGIGLDRIERKRPGSSRKNGGIIKLNNDDKKDGTFMKKSLINEVIPEEDEAEHDSKSIQQDPTKSNKQSIVSTVKIEINEENEQQQQEENKKVEKNGKLKNIFNKAIKTNETNQQQQQQQRKNDQTNVSGSKNIFHSKKQIDSIDEIENLSNNSNKEKDGGKDDKQSDQQSNKSIKSKSSTNALHRAFNKLKLIF